MAAIDDVDGEARGADTGAEEEGSLEGLSWFGLDPDRFGSLVAEPNVKREIEVVARQILVSHWVMTV